MGVTKIRQSKAFDAIEDAVALSFVQNDTLLRYCHDWKSWLWCDGNVWRIDYALRVIDTTEVALELLRVSRP